MVMSTVEVRAHSIRLGGQEQASIMPTRSADSSSTIKPRPIQVQADTASAYSVSGIQLTQGQQQATAVQIASKSLQTIGKELTHIKRGLTQAVTQGTQNVPGLQDTLVRSKANIQRVVEQARFDGQKVIDNELHLKLDKADIRRFSIPGLNVHRLSDRAEQIRLDFPQGQAVMIQFDGQSDGARTVKMLDRSLIAMGMRALLAEDGTILFEARDNAYQQMQQKVLVTGEGHRFPAGQPNVLNLKSEPDGIAELSFDLGSRDGIKQTISKVNQHLRQVQTSLEEAKAFHGELNTQMRSIQSKSHQLSVDEVNAKLDGFIETSGQFTSTFQALNAQANVRRHTVVALLK
ncbi:flagellin [Vibrio parahaemolyticus]|uniref:flagellin n=1 Tax=Vibrio parahaemolyticus TaxID=670 RepID=UPI0003F4C4B6|nr:flagellin [Vibrio parahaemolyticus]MBE4409904.1 flagellin [Vibrio parahaemolyticus]MCX8810177.1 flagellin [Vibrio parahaemolyticus]MCX8837255.1 flagellin [Vibrio parahaemolyticus]MCX8907393.1 flagellin [Vibrio parahaemolyticus]MDF4570980.1 flagellin [Vibrio parahaemolyticus]